MRINIYSQEITADIRLIEQLDRDGRNKHVGVRIFLASPDILHNTLDDDDRSAVTFWVPNCHSYPPVLLAEVLEDMGGLIRRHYGLPEVRRADVQGA